MIDVRHCNILYYACSSTNTIHVVVHIINTVHVVQNTSTSPAVQSTSTSPAVQSTSTIFY